MNLWSLTDLTLRGTDGQRDRLRAVKLEIRVGNTALVGDSGAGKSSLLGILVGLDRPSSGKVSCHLKQDHRLPFYWLPPGNGLWSPLSVSEHLKVVQPPNSDTMRIREELLDVFELRSLCHARPNELSQGEQSRLAMVRALASEAQVLILDEPLVHTSTLKQDRYWAYIRDYCRQRGISLIFATHDLKLVRDHADDLVVMEQDRVEFSGPWRGATKPAHDATAAYLKRIQTDA